jgi:hypothetical protein
MIKRKLSAMEDETIFDYDQFHLFPFDKIGENSKHITTGYKKESNELEWTIGRGGRGLRDWEWAIDIYYPNDKVEMWVFPPFLNAIFEHFERHGKDEIRSELNRLLGK